MVKIILMYFNCFSEYILKWAIQSLKKLCHFHLISIRVMFDIEMLAWMTTNAAMHEVANWHHHFIYMSHVRLYSVSVCLSSL